MAVTVLALALSGFGVLAVRARADEPSPRAGPPGLRVYTVGHSFLFWVAPILDDIAGKAGLEGHQNAGVAYRGGSTVQKIWEMPPGENARQALAGGKIDVLMLSPIWFPDEGIEEFTRFALEHNPDIRVTVQEFWLPNDTYHPVYPLEVKKYVDHNATLLTDLVQQNALYQKDVETAVRDLNRRLGKDVVFVVPVGEAVDSLRAAIVDGKAPGLKVQWRLFRDSWGHPTTPLRVLSAYCHYAVVYRRSPVGLPMPQEFLQNQEYASAGLNRLLQELAWNAVVHNPLTGVKP